jgi:hypothetical protein
MIALRSALDVVNRNDAAHRPALDKVGLGERDASATEHIQQYPV